MRLLPKTILFSSAMLVMVTSYAAPELKGTPDELQKYLQPAVKTISISGVAKETAYSDQAHVTLVVTTKEKTLTEALEKNSRIRKLLSASFVNAGIPQDKINNSQFSSSPQYGWFGKKPSEYEVVNRLKVTIESESQLTLLSKVADQEDEVVVGTIEFEHSKKKAFEKKARDAALDEAIAKSAGYADKLGLKLVPVAFSFYDIEPVRQRPSSLLRGVVMQANSKSKLSLESAAAPTPVTFDEVEYHARVNVIFEISAKQ